MGQSDIQSYLQQLSGIHTTSQQNVPGAVNNGNPNTVYNNPPGGGYLPPVSNALDQWRINPGAGINWQQLATQGGFGSGFNLSGIGPRTTTPPSGWHIPTPGTGGGTTPGGTPTPGTGGGGGVGTGGGGNIGNVNPGGNGLPSGGSGGGGSGQNRGADWYDFGGDRSSLGSLGFTDHPTSPNDVQSTSAFDPNGWGGLTTNDLNTMLGTGMPLGTVGQSLYGTPIGQAIGIKADGSISLGEIVDFFLPGNVFMGQTGKWNLMNALPGLLSKINPALGLATKAAMHWLADHTKIRALKDWQKKNMDNRIAGRGAGGSDHTAGGYGNGGQSNGGFIGGTLGWGGGTPTIEVGGTGPGQISDASGTYGNPMSMFDFHPSDVK